MWREESPSVKEQYARRAAEERDRHAQRFPGDRGASISALRKDASSSQHGHADYTYRPVMPPRRKAAKKQDTPALARPNVVAASGTSTDLWSGSYIAPADPNLFGPPLTAGSQSSSPPERPKTPPRNWCLFRSGLPKTRTELDPPLFCPPHEAMWPTAAHLHPELISPAAQEGEQLPVLQRLPALAATPRLLEDQQGLFMSFETMLATSPKSETGDLLVQVSALPPPDYDEGIENALQLSGLRAFAG